MRYRCYGLLLVVVLLYVPENSFGQESDDRSLRATLADALRWYYHWQMPLDSVGDLKCQGEEFRRRYFVYCTPHAVRIQIENDQETGQLRVQFVGVTPLSYVKSLDEFKRRSDNVGWAGRPIENSFSKSELSHYATDRSESETRDRSTQRCFEGFGRLVTPGTALFFPLVSRHDPFHHVYQVTPEGVQAVWEFSADRDCTNGMRWTYDKEHQSLPPDVDKRIRRPSYWLRTQMLRPSDK